MPILCFILGNNPLLSLAEIFCYAQSNHCELKIKEITRQALVVEAGSDIDVRGWQRSLGGCVKIGTVVQTYDSIASLTHEMNATDVIKKFLHQTQRKIQFGISIYGEMARTYQRQLERTALQVKRELSESGFSSRVITSDTGALTSVQITKNKIIERGAEILVIAGLNAFYLGKTLTVQEFEEYSYRDYERPERDSRSGMLPPKVAKIMINFSRTPMVDRLLDPFCGSGTILQEACLLGFEKLIGADISEKAISDTRNNLRWLAEHYSVPTEQIQLHISDVAHLAAMLQPESIDAIVTEPYLGPPGAKDLKTIDMLTLIPELESQYLTAFATFKKITKPGARIVIVFPLFKTKHGIYALKVLETLQQQGFRRVNPIPEEASLFAKVGPTARGSLVYSRPDQTVQRELFIFER
ncbi:MAG: methyltransferase domain-containing protein [Patescibacteria group bacterium]|nr:methyltransferase domain-containing protein [Patescibacteria group bacterium]MDD5715819.1 methyltransferase domain-containing protein [Patescibacteria group bacterium]